MSAKNKQKKFITYKGLLFLLYILFFERDVPKYLYKMFNVITDTKIDNLKKGLKKVVRQIIINIVADLFILAGIIIVALSLTIPPFLPLFPYGLLLI